MIRTRTYTEPKQGPLLPSYADDDDIIVYDFTPPPRTWRRRELVIGRFVFPLGRWHR